ncbi:phospholipase A2 domain-containing protein [Phlyctochytrium arcticum]|nr:phospholipase A2 domain-containing protein [Phlyctochytrium arcticum]
MHFLLTLLILALPFMVTSAPAPCPPTAKFGCKKPTSEGETLLLQWTQPNEVSRLQFVEANKTMDVFSAPSPYSLIFATDGCDKSPDAFENFDFGPACARHDFGYDNYKAIDALGPNKDRLDLMLYHDLREICGDSAACNAVAIVYYKAVQVGGKR